jgi:uncharacterized protein with FMN-binding domain
MSSKTKIVVLHMREVVYTAIFLLLAIVLGILLFFMFGPGKSITTSSANVTAAYAAGVYRTSIELDNNTFDVEVTVDADRIKSIQLVNLSENTAAMFPLMEPALESLASQIYSSQSLDDIQYADEQKYTSQMLLNAISSALDKARVR